MRVKQTNTVPGLKSARAVNGGKNVVTRGSHKPAKGQLGSHGSGLRGPNKDSMYNCKSMKSM